MMPPFVVFPTNRIAHFVEVSLYLFYLAQQVNLYSYMPRMYPFITGIKADYLISSHFSVDNFIFIIKANAQGELKCDFLCCSIFEI